MRNFNDVKLERILIIEYKGSSPITDGAGMVA